MGTGAFANRYLPQPAERVLTPRLVQILELAAEGRTVEDIAEELGVSQHAIYKQQCVINQALGADNIRHAVALAMRRGIIGQGPSQQSAYGHGEVARLLTSEADRVQRDQVHKPLPVDHAERCLTSLMEEVGEVAAAIQKRDQNNLQHELIQVGGIVIQWLARLAEINKESV